MEYGSCRSFTQCKQVPVGHMKLSLPSLLSLFIFSNVKTWTEPLHLPWFRKYDSHKNCFESFVSTILKKTFRLKSKLVKVTTTGSQPYLRIKLKQQYCRTFLQILQPQIFLPTSLLWYQPTPPQTQLNFLSIITTMKIRAHNSQSLFDNHRQQKPLSLSS